MSLGGRGHVKRPNEWHDEWHDEDKSFTFAPLPKEHLARNAALAAALGVPINALNHLSAGDQPQGETPT